MANDIIGLSAVIQLKHEKKAPRGISGEFKADITDERVVWTFKDKLSTMILASELSRLNTKEEKVSFDAKKGLGITEYPGKSKEWIKEKLSSELKKFQKK